MRIRGHFWIIEKRKRSELGTEVEFSVFEEYTRYFISQSDLKLVHGLIQWLAYSTWLLQKDNRERIYRRHLRVMWM